MLLLGFLSSAFARIPSFEAKLAERSIIKQDLYHEHHKCMLYHAVPAISRRSSWSRSGWKNNTREYRQSQGFAMVIAFSCLDGACVVESGFHKDTFVRLPRVNNFQTTCWTKGALTTDSTSLIKALPHLATKIGSAFGLGWISEQ